MKRRSNDKQAVPPIFNVNTQKIFEQVKGKADEAFEAVEARDRELANLPTIKGWQIYEEIVNQWVENLKSMVDPTSGSSIISINDSPFEIGLKYLLISFAISQIKLLLQIPKATLKGIDEAEKQRQQQGG